MKKLHKELEKRKALTRFFSDRMALMVKLLKCEHQGIRVNKNKMEIRFRQLMKKEKELQTEVIALFGASIDLGSLKSIREHLCKDERLRDALGVRSLTPTYLEDLALHHPTVLKIVMYRRVKQQIKEHADIAECVRKGRVYPLFSLVKPGGALFTSEGPKIDEAMLAGAIDEKILQRAWHDEQESLARLKRLSEDKKLLVDLQRGSMSNFIPGKLIPDGLDHGVVLLSLVTSFSDSLLSKQLLVPLTATMNLRQGVEDRYPAIFAWLTKFKKEAAVKSFVEFEGQKQYFEGIQSSDLNRRNRAITTGVRWALRYYV